MQTEPLLCSQCLRLVSLSLELLSLTWSFFRLDIAPLLVVAIFAAGFCVTLLLARWRKDHTTLVFAAKLGVTLHMKTSLHQDSFLVSQSPLQDTTLSEAGIQVCRRIEKRDFGYISLLFVETLARTRCQKWSRIQSLAQHALLLHYHCGLQG